MITIRFLKGPKTPSRKKSQEIGKKYEYSEDSYNSIIKMDKINEDLLKILNCVFKLQGSECEIDGEEIEPGFLLNITQCSIDKVPSTNLRWYYLERYSFRDLEIVELKERIERINEDELGLDYKIKDLQEINLISTIVYKKEYKVEKEKFKNFIEERTKVIKKVIPEFNNFEVLETIDKFPDKMFIKEEEFEEESIKGEEWVDWYDPVKWHKEVLDLLKKIEQNTRRGG